MPRVELEWWEGCPSTPRTRSLLREIMQELGLPPDALVESEIATEAEAAARGFVGSPTIRVDGRDIQPPADREPSGLTCRLYRRRDGAVSPLPDPADVRAALEEACRADR